MGEGVTPAESEPAIDLHRTGAIEPGEVERQNPVQRTIGQRQQFFAGDHRYRTAIGTGQRSAIGAVTVGVFRLIRGIVAMFLPANPGHGFRLVASNGHRILHQQNRRNTRGDLQRHGGRRFDRCIPGIDHQRFERASVGCQVGPGGELSQSQTGGRQPLPGLRGLDPGQHLLTQAQFQSCRTGKAHEQETDQYLRTNFRHDLGDVLRRQHPQPTGERREMNEHQRLVAQHQQHVGDGLRRGVQQRFKLGFGSGIQGVFRCWPAGPRSGRKSVSRHPTNRSASSRSRASRPVAACRSA